MAFDRADDSRIGWSQDVPLGSRSSQKRTCTRAMAMSEAMVGGAEYSEPSRLGWNGVQGCYVLGACGCVPFMFLLEVVLLATRMLHASSPSAGPPFPAARTPYGVDSECGTLKEVLLASPEHLSLVPCNAVSIEAVRTGRVSCSTRSLEQHRELARALTEAGVDVRLAPAMPGMPDLAFTRDTSLMTPWGLVGLRPGASHRRAEVDVVLRAAAKAGVRISGRVERGRVEGGDVCLLRPGVVAIGVSGERTDASGAEALGAMFKIHGWSVITTPIDAHLLHLDTHFCMLDHDLALGCTEKLDPMFLGEVARLGVESSRFISMRSPSLAATCSRSANDASRPREPRHASMRRSVGLVSR